MFLLNTGDIVSDGEIMQENARKCKKMQNILEIANSLQGLTHTDLKILNLTNSSEQ